MSGRNGLGLFAGQLLDLATETEDLTFELDDTNHPGEVQSIVGEVLDSVELVDVGVAVTATVTAGSSRRQQALPFVDPQCLWMNPGEFRGDRDHVHSLGVLGHHTPNPALGDSEVASRSASRAVR